MIIPSRWMNGGFGLDSFRNDMLSDERIRVLHDYLDANDCFSGISLTGGVCYFLWDRDNLGNCAVFTHTENEKVTFSERPLLEEGLSTFIRFNEAISILNKIHKKNEGSFADIVSQRDPFGLNYYENGIERMFKIISKEKVAGDCTIYSFGWQKTGLGYANVKYIASNHEAVNKFKVFISKANGAASSKAPYSVLSKPILAGPNTICNMTYLLVGPFDNEIEAKNVQFYISTKFFRFLVSLLKNTQNAYKKVYTYVPLQDFSKLWTDEDLYKKYGLNEEEIAFIETMIRPMDINENANDE